MEGYPRNGEVCPQLLDLIPDEREWVARRDEGNYGVSDDKKLELRLGLPGVDWFTKESNRSNGNEREESLLSLGCFSSIISMTPNDSNNSSSGSNTSNNNVSHVAKRGFLDTVEEKAEETWGGNKGNPSEKLSFSEKSAGGLFSSPWSSGSSPTPSNLAFQMNTQQQQQQQQLKPSFLQLPIPQGLPVMTKESPQACSTKVAELQNPEMKACSPASANTAVPNSSQKRIAPSPVVGWPPVRSFRKNLANSSSSKPPPPETHKVLPAEVTTGKPRDSKNLFVKINMDGVPIGRKVDLKAYDSYEKLSSAVDELFRGLLAAQRDSSVVGNKNKTEEEKAITGLLDGSGEYTLVYEDNEGDRMLVGDVPWHMFVSTVKRLRVLKSSELPALHIGSTVRGKTPLIGSTGVR
ncbi:PREDICTED: auxin-responsive protein IAA18-like isoform X2 [Nelumbo nucifera]|uniref:Auxin-responsive protein n=2 Tax=Nelumbo nucifera TaxID=4432 RepID=A0A1U8AVZ6_NELNU|nr:PREDICTED: auxin-responsive protein IAA18-like isoform X2 [Nelumbo nucifera]DAD48877.1 TPA_asm: hypothetical protein HUJ06_018814 [Nelumbo nucifera]